ncbi:MAG: AAA family ATPase [Polyangiaceae bacterium]|nr:AAA family ATPase [Polyangiaceae bacterium]
MFWLEGHTITEVLFEGDATTLYRGYRDTDGTSVLVKASNDDFPIARDVALLRHECAILQSLDVPCVPTAFGLVPCRNGISLVMSDTGKRPLTERMRRGRQDLGAALRVGVAIARALDQVHIGGVIHKDVCPQNILVEEGSLDVDLVGFGYASRLLREDQRLATTQIIEGSLAYMAPEQTGRINRAIDHRADLYSLGVTLYELLTGVLPFTMDEPLGLLHAHIARAPVPPHVLVPELPRVVSDIVIKLLAKSADDRYHRAGGVATDLAICARQWQNYREIDRFALGERDLGSELILPDKLYGRDVERKDLEAAFERAATGHPGLVVISGAAGVGKSVLARELKSPVAVRGGTFAAGRPDELTRGAPCGVLSAALRDLVRQILQGPSEPARVFTRELHRMLGATAAALFEIVPELEDVVEARELPAALPAAESNARLAVLVRSLIDAASREGPVVLFLDDMDSADAASKDIARALVVDGESRRLCVVMACRDRPTASRTNIVDLPDLRRAGVSITEIHLGPLSAVHTRALLADALGAPEDRVIDLADELTAAAHGNPFFLREVLRALHTEELVKFDSRAGSFKWDIERVRQRLGSADARDFVRDRIGSLPARTSHALAVAACLGTAFDLGALAVAVERPPADVVQDLWPALEAGLIVPLSSDYRFADALVDAAQANGADTHRRSPDRSSWEVPYAFAHGHVHDAALALVPPESRAHEHLRIGRLLLASAFPTSDGGGLAAVRQLNLGRAAMQSEGDRISLARLDLNAGRRAKGAGALADAMDFFKLGLEALDAKEPHELWFALTYQFGECAVTTGAAELSARHVEELVSGARTALERAEACRLRVAMLVMREKLDEAFRAGVAGLEELGIRMPEDEAAWRKALDEERAAIDRKLADRPIRSLKMAPRATDPEIVATMFFLLDLSAPAFLSRVPATRLVTAVLVRLSIEHGNTEASAYGFAAYGFFLAADTNRFDEAHAFGELGLALDEEFGEGRLACRVRIVAGSMLHTKRSRRVSLFHFQRAVELAATSGDLLYVSHAAGHVIATRFELGDDLARACEETERSLTFVRAAWGARAVTDPFVVLTLQAARCLLGKTRDRTSLSDDTFDAEAFVAARALVGDGSAELWYSVLRAQIFILHEEFGAAARDALVAEKHFAEYEGQFVSTDISFWVALSLLLDRSASRATLDSRLATVETHLARLAVLAEHCPENYERKYLLVAAERARAVGDELSAVELYERAGRAATESGSSRDEALVNELAARFHLERRRDTLARAYMGSAYQAYMRWGAIAKIGALRERYGFLLPRRPAGSSEGPTRATIMPAPQGQYDIEAVMRAAQAIAEELVLDVLLDRVMRVIVEASGAQRAVLLLDRGGGLSIEACMTIDPDRVLVGSDAAAAVGWELPQSIVEEVEVTRNPVVVGGIRGFDRFSRDPYIVERRPRSFLCLALVHRGRLTGILCLENRLVADVFTAERIQIAGFLSSLAAIALENSLLVASIQRMSESQIRANERLEMEVLARTEDLERELEQRKAAELDRELMHTAMLSAQAERLAELSTPLLPITGEIMVMPLIGMIDQDRAEQVLTTALAGVSSSNASVLILDITGVRNASTNVAKTLIDATRAVSMLGAEVVISGVRAAVAHSLVDVADTMQGIVTKATLAGAVAHAMGRGRRKGGGRRA